MKDYDIEDVKAALFSLPFTAFCALSCSGDGCFALLSIAEPDKLDLYTEHLFAVLIEDYGIKPDTGKGMNAHDLRYCSYDGNMLIREKPEPLYVTHFRQRKEAEKERTARKSYNNKENDVRGDVERLINEITSTHTDITEGYQNWLSMGFALASEFGEAGRGYYHDVSAINAGYQARECDNQYTKCLDSKGQGITIKTFFGKCKEAGLLTKQTI